MIRSGARRLLAFLAVLAVAPAPFAALLGVATGNGVARSVAIGYYAVGSLAALAGFAVGSRGMFRPLPRRDAPLEARSVEEVRESRAVAALLMLAGVALLVVGVALDPRAHLL